MPWAGFEESGKCTASGHAICIELVSALEPPQRNFRAWTEVPVDRKNRTILREQELGYRDVPAQRAVPQDPASEAMPPQSTKGAARCGTNPPVYRQSAPSLKNA